MATSPSTQIIIDRGIPPEADFVFTSVGGQGGAGPLFQFVLESTGHAPPDFDSKSLEAGFAIFRREGLPALVCVVTVSSNGSAERNLRENLRRGLSAIASDLDQRSIWLPLMGTGAGGLDFNTSFMATLDALGESGVIEKGNPAQIAIAMPDEANDEALRGMQGRAADMFGDMVMTLSQPEPPESSVVDEPSPEAVKAGEVPRSAASGPAPTRERASSGAVREVQARLAELGYEPGEADGLPGPRTAAAIRRFQTDHDLPETGEIDARLITQLRDAQPLSPPPPPPPPPPPESKTPPKTPPPQPARPGETTPFYPDHPAHVDALGREAIAEAIATIVHDARRQSDAAGGPEIDRTFMVHIHGRWGSGKTSILNFLRGILTSGAEGQPWVVVDYNAWRNQGHGPAWWTLLNRVYTEAVSELGGLPTPEGRKLIRSDALWRMRSGWVPYAIMVAVVLVLVAIWTAAGGISTKDGLAVLASIVAISTGVFTFGGTYRIGSARTASKFLELTRDPLRPLTRRYEEMIGEIARPVAVFIDDLDRCDAEFVVELLQSIQTLYRRARVLYVVAADRDWVCTSYEQKYQAFREPIGEPGRPLGHLFLEKIFQISITVPNLSADLRREYWKQLVQGGAATAPARAAEIRDQEKAIIGELKTEGEIRAHTEEIRDDPVRRRIAGAQAFRRLQSPELRAEREHFLTGYADLLEPNPRAMKRLVNAYGFKRGFELMAGLESPPDALVRWTVLELRWPELAAHLAKHPDDIAVPKKPPAKAAPEAVGVKALLADPEVRRVAAGLTPALVRRVVGNADAESANEPTAA